MLDSTELNIPNTITFLKSEASNPYGLGKLCGTLMEIIPIVVKVHLDHDACYTTNRSASSINISEFTAGLDTKLAKMRTADNLTGPFPDALATIHRRQRRHRRKHCDKYIRDLQTALAHAIIAGIGDVMFDYLPEETKLFNKGVDLTLMQMSWRLYPTLNVALEAEGPLWGDWLQRQCAQLGWVSVEQDLPVFDD